MSADRKDATHLGTKAVHAGEPLDTTHHSLVSPLFPSSTYTFPNFDALLDMVEGRSGPRDTYARYGNPTVRAFEEKIASLEGAEEALAFSSGMAALTTAVLALVKSGSHVVLVRECYRHTLEFTEKTLSRFGVSSTTVPPCDLAALEAALRPETRLVLAELPTNPFLRVPDLRALTQLCRARRVKTLIDATFATPINIRPLSHGADLVVHSATKYLAGHNDALAGVLAGPTHLLSLVRELRNVLGNVSDPHTAWLCLRGCKTLALRVKQQNETALKLARSLQAHRCITQVWYPMLPEHPDHVTSRGLLTGGGGVVTYNLQGDRDSVRRYLDGLRVSRIALSLGGVESLVGPPAIISYFDLPAEERAALGIEETLVRHSVGIEDADDVIADVHTALNGIDRLRSPR